MHVNGVTKWFHRAFEMTGDKQNQVNVDDTEIEKFSRSASRWWDTEGEFKSLHQINPLRLNYIDGHSRLAGCRVLDAGCGGGILSEAMALKGADVTGIDMGEAQLEVARLHALENQVKNIEYLKITVERLAEEKPGYWDIVTCMELLEHVPDPASIVQACGKLVKPGGIVYFSTINRHPKAFVFAILGAEYALNLLPTGTHQYEKFIRPSELDRWGDSCNLITRDLTGLHYNPVLKTYRLGPGLEVNYIARMEKPVGH